MVLRVVIGAPVITECPGGQCRAARDAHVRQSDPSSPLTVPRLARSRAAEPGDSSIKLSSSATGIRGKAAAVPTSAMAQPSKHIDDPFRQKLGDPLRVKLRQIVGQRHQERDQRRMQPIAIGEMMRNERGYYQNASADDRHRVKAHRNHPRRENAGEGARDTLDDAAITRARPAA
jgi:hypothetical protein